MTYVYDAYGNRVERLSSSTMGSVTHDKFAQDGWDTAKPSPVGNENFDDNAKTTVAKIVGNRERVVTREFGRLMSHFLFATHFCLVRRPNEKAHVERLVEYARSNFLVPVPQAASLDELQEFSPLAAVRPGEIRASLQLS